MMFYKFLTQSVHLGFIRGHTPPEDGVLRHFQQVLSLNIGDTELDLGRSFDSISLKHDRTIVSIEGWSFIVFGPFGPMRGELGVIQIREFWENEDLTTHFSEIQQFDNLL